MERMEQERSPGRHEDVKRGHHSMATPAVGTTGSELKVAMLSGPRFPSWMPELLVHMAGVHQVIPGAGVILGTLGDHA